MFADKTHALTIFQIKIMKLNVDLIWTIISILKYSLVVIETRLNLNLPAQPFD